MMNNNPGRFRSRGLLFLASKIWNLKSGIWSLESIKLWFE